MIANGFSLAGGQALLLILGALALIFLFVIILSISRPELARSLHLYVEIPKFLKTRIGFGSGRSNPKSNSTAKSTDNSNRIDPVTVEEAIAPVMEHASEASKQAKARSDSDESLLAKSKSLRTDGKTKEALQVLRKIIKSPSVGIMAQCEQAGIYLEQRDHASAIREYSDILRSDRGCETARCSIKEIRHRVRASSLVRLAQVGDFSRRVFCFAAMPTPASLAQHISALSNESGGIIYIGLDESRHISGLSFDRTFDEMLDRIAIDFCRPLCLFEKFTNESNTCKVIVVEEGLCKPHGVCEDGESKVDVFLIGGDGKIHLATRKERQELKLKHRPIV